MSPAGFSPLIVIDVERDTPESVIVTLEPEDPDSFRFVHGQHLTLRRQVDGIELRRSYSICSPAPDGALRVGIRRVDGGAFSTWATSALRPGDAVEALPPTGSFTHELEPGSRRSYVLVAGGSGITPIYSIAATVLEHEPSSVVTLLQVDRTTASIMLLDDVEALRNRFLERFRVWRQLTREDHGLDLLSGRPDPVGLDACIEHGILDAEPDHVFICGPAGIVETVQTVYGARGLAPERLHTELFTTAQQGRARRPARGPVDESVPPIGSGEVVLAGRGSSFALYAGDSILDAVQRVRPEVPYSCQAGVCSTCRARLDEGAVEMETTHGLVPGDEANGFVLTCQAVPTTTTFMVDFDA